MSRFWIWLSYGRKLWATEHKSHKYWGNWYNCQVWFQTRHVDLLKNLFEYRGHKRYSCEDEEKKKEAKHKRIRNLTDLRSGLLQPPTSGRIDTWINKGKRIQAPNCKHALESISNMRILDKHKDFSILQEQTCWAEFVLGSVLCLTVTVNRVWITFWLLTGPWEYWAGGRSHFLLPRGLPCADMF